MSYIYVYVNKYLNFVKKSTRCNFYLPYDIFIRISISYDLGLSNVFFLILCQPNDFRKVLVKLLLRIFV